MKNPTHDTIHHIGGGWEAGGGPSLVSVNPADGTTAWTGRSATAEEVDGAVRAAAAAWADWSALTFDRRVASLQVYAQRLE